MSFRAQNWNVPIVSEISPHGMRHGDSIFVEGTMTGMDGFSVNLIPNNTVNYGGAFPVVLHVNPRPKEGQVVMNTYTGGWQSEERKPLPIPVGAFFRLRIACEGNCFSVFLNETHLHTFNFRLPSSEAKHVAIVGSILLHRFWMEGHMTSLGKYVYHGLGPGNRIHIAGTPEGQPRFTVNIYQQGNVAFHFNPRFDQGQTVCNTSRGGSWDPSEQRTMLPFQQMQLFDVVIHVNHNDYAVFVNGQHLLNYPHRLGHHGLSAVELKDFRIKNFAVC